MASSKEASSLADALAAAEAEGGLASAAARRAAQEVVGMRLQLAGQKEEVC